MSMAGGSSGRRRLTNKLFSAEEQALDQIAREAEARLAARRQARAEAREIRMRELEKQQKENDETCDRHYDLINDPLRSLKLNGREVSASPQRLGSIGSTYSVSSRRSSSEDSAATATSGGGNNSVDGLISESSRELKAQLSNLEEKFRLAMVSNAQLDNEKSTATYRVDTLKDELEELEEQNLMTQREFREKSRLCDQLKRETKKLTEERDYLQECLKQRDQLIQEYGLYLVGGELVNGTGDGVVGNGYSSMEDLSHREDEEENGERRKVHVSKAALVSIEAAQLLQQAGEGSLDLRLKRFAEEKQDLLDEIYRLRLELEEERQKSSKMEQLTSEDGSLDLQREASKQVSDYKFKLKKSEQEIATLQASVVRLEGQVTRYKTASEEGEKVEDELKAEKRKLQREFREAQARVEELETANAHLQKRIDKLKSARNALLKT